jgi:RDD family
MTSTSTHRDPRSVVTPDAFEVSRDLLGLQLAPPFKRLAAITIDLVVIGIVTLVTKSFALIVGIILAALFVRAGFKRTPVRGSVFDRAMRASVGCLGVFIAFLTVVLWASLGPGGRHGTVSIGDGGVTVRPDSARLGGLLGAVANVAVSRALEQATTLDEAERAARQVISAADQLGMDRSQLRGLLTASVPPSATWADSASELFDRLLPAPEEPALERIESRDARAIRDEVSMYSTQDALEEYAALLRSGRDTDMDQARREALAARLATDIAADTLRALQLRIAGLQQDSQTTVERLDQVQRRLDESRSGGFFGWVRSALNELGFGFGWASVYLTVMLSWWKGQTIGKRIMGIRVLRLDGAPITWWVAFERAGGYAAGFATGLLGFAQVFWDANRQAIHDRIVGTVVVLDGAEKLLDWESAL